MASILTQQRLIFSVCFVLFFVRSFFRRFFLYFPPIVHGRRNSTLLWMGHWAFWARASLTGVKRCLDRRPPRRARAALELSVQHLGANSRNVGLKNANFASDLTDTEKINAADAQKPQSWRRKQEEEVQRITSTFWSSRCICSSWAWRRLSSRFSSPADSPLSCDPSPSCLSSPPAALSRRTRWLTLTPKSSGLRGEGERARGEGLGDSEDEEGGKTKD